jgi:hypothetical protein
MLTQAGVGQLAVHVIEHAIEQQGLSFFQGSARPALQNWVLSKTPANRSSAPCKARSKQGRNLSSQEFTSIVLRCVASSCSYICLHSR